VFIIVAGGLLVQESVQVLDLQPPLALLRVPTLLHGLLLQLTLDLGLQTPQDGLVEERGGEARGRLG